MGEAGHAVAMGGSRYPNVVVFFFPGRNPGNSGMFMNIFFPPTKSTKKYVEHLEIPGRLSRKYLGADRRCPGNSG